MSLSRRKALLGVGALTLAGVGAFVLRPQANLGTDGTMTPDTAHRASAAGEVLLVDIRRPEEWKATGLAPDALPLDMRREDFVPALLAARGATDIPVALICARGVRSRHVTQALTEAGLQAIIDVPEGMLGSRAGPGWIARSLPLVEWTGKV